jgi:hypothetical protein
MGIILVILGFSVCLVAIGIESHFNIGVFLLGILFAGLGIALVRSGLRHRPHDARKM